MTAVRVERAVRRIETIDCFSRGLIVTRLAMYQN